MTEEPSEPTQALTEAEAGESGQLTVETDATEKPEAVTSESGRTGQNADATGQSGADAGESGQSTTEIETTNKTEEDAGESGQSEPVEAKPKPWAREISKKIAILTKEVFRMHAESVERKGEADELQERYAQDLAQAVEVAKVALEEARKDADKFRENAEESTKEAYDSEMAALQEKFEDAKRTLEGRSQDVIEETEIRLKELQKEAETMVNASKEYFDLVQGLRDKMAGLSGDTLGRVQENHKLELQKLVTEANRKYNLVVLETAKREQVLVANFERDVAKLQQTLAEGKVSPAQLLAQEQKELQARVVEMEKEKELCFEAINSMKRSLQKDQTRAEDIIQQIMNRKTVLSMERTNAAKDHTAALNARQAEHKAEIKGITDGMVKRDADHAAQVTALRQEIDTAKSEQERRAQELGEQGESDNARLSPEDRSAIAQINREYAIFTGDSKKKEDELNAEIEELQKQQKINVSDLSPNLEEERKAHQERINGMKSAHTEDIERIDREAEREKGQMTEDLNNVAESLSLSVEELEQKAESMKRETLATKERAAAEKRKREQDRELALVNLRKDHDALIAKLRAEHTERLTKMEVESVRIIAQQQVGQQKRLELAKIEAGNILKRDECERRHLIDGAHRRSVSAMQVRWEKKMGEMRRKIDERLRLNKEANKAAAREGARKQSLMQHIRDEIAGVDGAWAKEKTQLQEEWMHKLARVRDKTAAYEKKDEEQKLIREEIRARELKKRTHEFTVEEKQKQVHIAELKMAVENEKIWLEDNPKRPASEFQSLRAQRSYINEESQKQIARLNDEADERVKQIEKERAAEMTHLKEQLKLVHEKGETDLGVVRRDMEKIRHTHDQQIESMRRKIETEANNGAQKIADMKARSERDLQDLEAQQKVEIDNLKEFLVQLQEEAKHQAARHKEMLDKLQREYEAKLDVMRRNKPVIAGQPAESVGDASRTVAELEAEISEWNEKYETREARAQDLERIKKLQTSVQERTDAIEKAKQDLRALQEGTLTQEEAASRAGGTRSSFNSGRSSGGLPPLSTPKLRPL